jgi:23S rRNA-intervening sequence protein
VEFSVLSKTDHSAWLPITALHSGDAHNLDRWDYYGALLSRIDRMAESYEVSHRNLRSDAAVSERGALRAHQPIAASVRFSAKQYWRKGRPVFRKKEFHHFLSQARGSLVEIETQLLIARALTYFQPAKADILLAAAEELGRI